MSNFAGWLLVGLAMLAMLQLLDMFRWLEPKGVSILAGIPGARLLGPILYVCILVFNLTMTFWIGEHFLGIVGCLILFFPSLLVLFFTLYKNANLTPTHIARHRLDFPLSGVPCPPLSSDAILNLGLPTSE